jgi:CheY-like chemotaxis protein
MITVPPEFRPLDNLRVLLVEDQSLIAMDTEELLRSLGANDVAVAPTVVKALQLIAEEEPACAVLDLNLGSSTSEDVARELQRLRVPYVFATGYRDSSNIPDGFSNVPVVRKPVSQDALSRAMSEALGISE